LFERGWMARLALAAILRQACQTGESRGGAPRSSMMPRSNAHRTDSSRRYSIQKGSHCNIECDKLVQVRDVPGPFQNDLFRHANPRREEVARSENPPISIPHPGPASAPG